MRQSQISKKPPQDEQKSSVCYMECVQSAMLWEIMNVSLMDHVLVLHETLHNKSVCTLLLLLLLSPTNHCVLEWRASPLFSLIPPALHLSLSLSLFPSLHSFRLSFLLIHPSSSSQLTHTHTYTLLPHAVKQSQGSLRFPTQPCTRMAIGWHLQYDSVQHFYYRHFYYMLLFRSTWICH